MNRTEARKLYDESASEYDLCVELTDWMRLAKLNFIHVQNEQSTTAAARGTLKYRLMRQARIGVERDFPDYLIFDVPPRQPQARGVAIEMKKPGKRPTPGQIERLRAMQGLGYATGWFDSADDAITFLESLGFKAGAQRREH
jgi:hypothetical protein